LKLTSNAANTAASFLADIRSSGNFTNSTLGMCLHVDETGTAAGTSYAAYVSATANSPLGVYSTATTTPASKFWGIQAQTTSILSIDGTTGTGWDGATNVGMLHISVDDAMIHANATELFLGATAAIDDSRGHCLRIVDSSSVAGAMGYPAFITSNDATMGGLMITTEATATALAITAGVSNVDGPVALGSILKFDGTPDTVTGASLASSLTSSVTYIDSTAGAITPTLADGAQGQIKFVCMTVDNGDATFTPANPQGFASVKFTAVGQTALLIFLNSKWHLIQAYGCTIA
jgi:hypothetical protein